MYFDETGHQHALGVTVVDPIRAPAGEHRLIADTKNASIADRDCGRERLYPTHREDSARGMDDEWRGRSAHGRSGERKCERLCRTIRLAAGGSGAPRAATPRSFSVPPTPASG